jgi:hypothetical protein
VTIGATPVPQGSPLDIFYGAGKAVLSDLLYILTLPAGETDMTRAAQEKLRLTTKLQKTGALGLMMYQAATGIMEVHHLLPREFQPFFKAAGLEMEDYTIKLDRAAHRLKAGNGVHTIAGGDWNGVWEKWIAQNPGARKNAILKQLSKMRKQFGI